ncbi:MAG: undecaprenyldiphospho-muramoylpentapeptide beta-N-acetylglucosaminyltransferase [Saccharofermentanales bacterium]
MEKRRYIIAAGGTSGHINPAIAIADEIKKREPDAQILFCGTDFGMENDIVPKHGYDLTHIDALGFPSKPSKKLFFAIKAFFNGRRQSRKLLEKIKPDAVIGTGGYVCGPVVSMAESLKIPSLIHEQNAYPGKANRFLARKADVVCISFPGAGSYFRKAKKVVMTGNPVREVFFGLTKEMARKELNIRMDEKLLFATGGSLGARTINQAVMDIARYHKEPGFSMILACGKKAYPSLKEEADKYFPALTLKEYIYNQHLYLAAADIVLCRAGALTCSEIAVLSKASVMVPYPYAAGDHQTFNAKTFSDIGASVLITDNDLDHAVLYEQVRGLFADPERIAKMESLAGTLALPDATSRIYDELQEIIRKKSDRT